MPGSNKKNNEPNISRLKDYVSPPKKGDMSKSKILGEEFARMEIKEFKEELIRMQCSEEDRCEHIITFILNAHRKITAKQLGYILPILTDGILKADVIEEWLPNLDKKPTATEFGKYIFPHIANETTKTLLADIWLENQTNKVNLEDLENNILVHIKKPAYANMIRDNHARMNGSKTEDVPMTPPNSPRATSGKQALKSSNKIEK